MIGQTLSHYTVHEKIGEGGMGVVYRAEDIRLGRQVAIKVLSAHLTEDASSRQRFLAEARAASALDHRNVCVVHDIGEAPDGQMFMVMPFYEGESLRQRVLRGPLPLGEAVALAAQIAAGLARAHAVGIVHRDIKPANVVVTRDGEAKILDFGIAKLASDPGVTRSGMIVGTLYYLSPEQFASGNVDARADLWSLGVLLYELVTGRVPFRGTGQAQIVHGILHREPDLVPLHQVGASELAVVIGRCLAKDPLDRPQNALELLSELRRIESALPGGIALAAPGAPAAALPTVALPSPARPGAKPPSPLSRPSHGSSSSLNTVAAGFRVVGRERELERLTRLSAEAKVGGVRVAFVCGEAGRGKSTLLQQLARQLDSSRWLTVFGACNAQSGPGDPYLPFREILAQLAGDVGSQDAPSRRSAERPARADRASPGFAKAVLEHGPNLVGTLLSGPQLLANLRSSAHHDERLAGQIETLIERRGAVDLRAEAGRSELLEQVTRVLQSVAETQPLVLVLEDLHWVDAGSAGLLVHLARCLGEAPVLLIGSYRREELALAAGLERHPLDAVVNELTRQFGEIEIDLDRDEPNHFVDALLDPATHDVDEGFRRELTQRTGGLPLFVTELVRSFRDDGLLARREDGVWVLAGGPIDWNQVPRRVESVVAERVERLPAGLRSLLGIASIEGEELTAEVVARVAGLDEREVLRLLSNEAARRYRMVVATGVRRIGERRLSQYRFRHELFPRFLVARLDPVERCVLHEEVAMALQDLWGPRSEEISPRLAHHYLEAQIPMRAIEFLRLAALRASRVSAHEEAISHLRRALDELESGNLETSDGVALELTLLMELAPALIAVHGFTATEVEAVYLRGRELCALLPHAPDLPVLWGLFAFSSVRGELESSLPLARQMLERATTTGDPGHLVQAHYTLGATQLLRGELGEALEHLDAAAPPGLDLDGSHFSLTYAMDSRKVAAAYGSLATWLRGDETGSVQRARAALDWARVDRHPLTASTVLLITGLRHAVAGDWRLVGHHGSEMSAINSEFGLFQTREAAILEALSRAAANPTESTVAAVGDAITPFRAEGWSVFVPLFLGLLAALWLEVGETARAEVQLDEARTVADRTGERFWIPELLRLEALCAEHGGGAVEQVRESLRTAAGLARHQGNLALELRLAVELARRDDRDLLVELLAAPSSPDSPARRAARELLAATS